MTILSPAALAVITAAELDDGEQRNWFPVLCHTADPDALTESWDVVADGLAAAAAAAGVATTTVETGTEALARELDPLAVLRELHEAGPDEVQQAYAEARTDDVPDDAVDEEPGDEDEPSAGYAEWSAEPAAESVVDSEEAELPDATEFPPIALGAEGDWVAYADALLVRAGF